jgi:hypothetical protein
MQLRRPTSGLTPANGSSIRRRSGVWSPNPDNPESVAASERAFSTGLMDHAGDQLGVVVFPDTPTVHLVNSSARSLSPLPFLPDFAVDADQNNQNNHGLREPEERTDQNDALFSHVPLTPRPDVPSRTQSQSSHLTSASRISRLPTPDFVSPDPNGRPYVFRSFLPRGLSFLSFRRPPAAPFVSTTANSLTSFTNSHQHKGLQRHESDTSESSYAQSSSSGYTSHSVDSGHRNIVQSVGTTEKFTHKWPKPRSLRYLDGGGNSKSRVDVGLKGNVATTLEEGRGLGMNKVERWSTHKWCLLISVSTIFVYGAAGLACAILTWFRSKSTFSKPCSRRTYLPS